MSQRMTSAGLLTHPPALNSDHSKAVTLSRNVYFEVWVIDKREVKAILALIRIIKAIYCLLSRCLKNSGGFNGIQTHDLCNDSAMLYQLVGFYTKRLHIKNDIV